MLALKSHDQKHKYGVARRRFAYPMMTAVVFAVLLGAISLRTTVTAFPGQLDSTYGQNGTAVLLPTIYPSVYPRAAIQPDGKVVVAYTRLVPGQSPSHSPIVARFLPNGQLNTVGEWPTVTGHPFVRLNFHHRLTEVSRAWLLTSPRSVAMRVISFSPSGSSLNRARS